MSEFGPNIDRRTAVKIIGGGTISVAAGGGALLKHAANSDEILTEQNKKMIEERKNAIQAPEIQPTIEADTKPPEYIQSDETELSPEDIFKSAEVNAIIKDKEFTMEDFISLKPTVPDNLYSHLAEEKILEIYTPEVKALEDEIKTASDDFSLPVNVIAAMVSFELNGQPGDHVDVRKLVKNFEKVYRDVNSEMEPTLPPGSPKARNANVIIATLGKIRAEQEGESTAFASSDIRKPDTVPFKTRLYMSKLAKMFITIELAHTLRDEYGWEDSKITEELSGSEELNARAWAIQQVLHGDLSLPTTSQEAFFDFMAQPKLPEKGKNEDEQAVLQAYRQYLNHETDERFRLKLNPALRFDAAVNPKKYIMGSTNSNADDYLDSETNT